MPAYSNPTLATSFEGFRLLSQSDTDDLPVTPVGLRIANLSSNWAEVTVLCLGETGPTKFDVPPGCILSEPIRVKRIYIAGTTSGLNIHGYFHA